MPATIGRVGAIAAAVFAAATAGAQCSLRWINPAPATFSPGFVISDLITFDDGLGEAVYAVGPLGAPTALRFNGSAWSAFGPVVSGGRVVAGWNGSVYIAGTFTAVAGTNINSIARWNGSSWVRVGTGVIANGVMGDIYAVESGADSGGPALFVGGVFSSAGANPAANVARWNGSAWSALGQGLNGVVNDLVGWNSGAGPTVVAVGNFTHSAALSLTRVARWSGSSWSPLGSGVNDTARCAAIFDDGSGPKLYVGGDFTVAGGVPANRVACWNGSGWAPLATGFDNNVLALAVLDEGDDEVLYAAGDFTGTGGFSATGLVAFGGASWAALPPGPTPSGARIIRFDAPSGPRIAMIGLDAVHAFDGLTYQQLGGIWDSRPSALAQFDDGGGPQLYAAGSFQNINGVTAVHAARFNGASWQPLGNGFNQAPDDIFVYDGSLHVAGGFSSASGIAAAGIGAYDGAAWDTLGGGTSGVVRAVTTFDLGAGPVLIAGGSFTTAGGAPAGRIASWNGAVWQQIGSGFNDDVRALAVFDAGSGPQLYAAGLFQFSGATPVSRIAVWTPAGWAPVGGGVNDSVEALAAVPNGPLAGLYATGSFSDAGGAPAGYIARWSGSSWSPLSFGLGASGTALAYGSIAGGPEALYVGGSFNAAGAVSARHVAKWDGSDWSLMGTGLSPIASASVRNLLISDVGGANELFVSGQFTSAGGTSAANIARWNGVSWSALGSGVNNSSTGLAEFDADGPGPEPEALWVSGSFTAPFNRLAVWNGAAWSAPPAAYSGGVDLLQITTFGGSPRLYVGGGILSLGAAQVRGIARWSGSAWTQGMPLVTRADRAAVLDTGSGPNLYISGLVTGTGSGPIKKWNGTVWSDMSNGVNSVGPRCFEVFDPDGPGPQPARIVIGGEVSSIPGGLAEWTGTQWLPLGGGVTGTVTALEVVDFDGAGPQNSVLLVGGGFTAVGPALPAHHFAVWDGASWLPVTGTDGLVPAILGTDLGSGPRAYLPINAARVDFASLSRIARWNGSSWSPLQNGADRRVDSLVSAALGGSPALYAGGELQSVANVSTGSFNTLGFAKWGWQGAGPSITQHPSGQSVAVGAAAGFSVAVSDSQSVEYQWRRDGADLTNSGLLTGADSPTMSILSAELSDAGEYDCVISNACGTSISNAATLTVSPQCGSPDFDGDGDTGTDADIEAFLLCLGGSCCATCGSADFDQDGDTGTDADVEAFFRVLGGGQC